MFPILFKLGYTKGRFFGFYLPLILIAVILGIYTGITYIPGNGGITIKLISFASEHLLLISGGMIILATILLFISYFISVRVYSKRDF